MTDDRSGFRYTIGVLVTLGGLAALAGLYFIAVPESNREPLLLAIGLVLGWGSAVVNYEFGSSSAGRKAADAGIAKIAEAPQPVAVVNPPEAPIPVEPTDAAELAARLKEGR